MALKYIVDTLDGLDASVASLYEQADGKFRLNVEGVAPREKLDEFRNKNIDLMRQLDTFKGVDLTKYQNLLGLEKKLTDKELIDAGKVDEVVQSRIASMKTEHEQIVNQLNTQLSDSNKQLESLLIDSAVRMQALNQKVIPSAIDDVMLRARMSFKIVEGKAVPHADGKPVYGKDGVNPMSVEEWISGLAKNAPHLFEGSQGGGARGSQGRGGPNAANMTATQKIAAGFNSK